MTSIIPQTITKKHLGWLVIALGLGADAAILVLGRLGGGQWSGIGPVERTMLLAGLGVAALGAPLLLWGGDAPAARVTEPRYAAQLPAPASQRERALRWLGRGLAALAVIAFLGYLAVYVTYAVDLFRWPYDYDQGESFELYDAVLHSQGKWPYRDSNTYPFYASNYPPVFHLLMIPLFPIFGPTLLAGRVLSFTITLLTAGLIGWTVRRRTGGIFLPAMAALAYPASNFVYHVGPLCRQQLTMVFFETLAVFFIAGVYNENGETSGKMRLRPLLLGLGCLLLAGYTKQLAVFTAAAVFGYLFLRRPLRAIALAAGFGAVFGLIFLSINWATDGQWWLNTIAANVNAYEIPRLIGLARNWFKIHPVWVLLAVGMIGYEAYVERLSIYAIWFVSGVGMGLLSGKWGAGEAYWVTSVAAAIILAGFALGRVRDGIAAARPRWASAFAVLVPLLFLVQASRMIHLPTEGPVWGTVARALNLEGESVYADYAYFDAVGYTQVGHLMRPRDYEGGARIMAYVEATDKPIFSEEAAFSMRAGKQVVTNPTQLLNLYNNGLLDTTELEAMIRQEAFGLVIMRAQFYPPPVLAAIGQHYGLVEHVPMNGFNYIIMQPLGNPVE